MIHLRDHAPSTLTGWRPPHLRAGPPCLARFEAALRSATVGHAVCDGPPMPSMFHEALVALFENRLALAPELLRDALGVAMPAWKALRRESAELTQLVPTEYRADFVVSLGGGASRLAVVVEVQLQRDDAKRWSWPVYLTTLRARLGCGVVLLVVAPDPAVARWAGSNIEMGHPGLRLAPLVVSSSSVPAATSSEQARASPELAVLTALVHGHGDAERAAIVAKSALDACASLDDERARLYADLVYGGLGEAARAALEAMMIPENYEYQSDFARKYYGKGKAEGKAEGLVEGKANALLVLLAARGLQASESERERIGAERDLSRLDAWIARAVRVATVGELFADDATG